VADPHRTYEIRCPVYGFIELTDWEREIIAQPAFQRLRRIRQLAWTDQVYPGAMHTRFEHSLGVMHVASLLYDAVVKRSSKLLKSELGYNEVGLERDRALVRLAALLHDVGHGPFSHAAEDLFPPRGTGTERYKHEHYSAAIVRRYFGDTIETHRLNNNYGWRAEDVAAFLEGSTAAQKAVFWRELLDGHMDADRMDYLQRDSLHAGVRYGRFDIGRLIRTAQAVVGDEGEGLRLGVSEGGWHAAEGLLLARYFMFTQVYFHKTRVAYDYHLRQTLRELLSGQPFPSPNGAELDEYLKWDDWRVLGLLSEGEGGEHGTRLSTRNHYREVFHTPETPTQHDFARLDRVREALGSLLSAEERSKASWYNAEKGDIPVASEIEEGRIDPLSKYSSVVDSLSGNRQVRLYVRPEAYESAQRRVQSVEESSDG
jgi:HD superfamily phosphohydrolase